MKKKLCYSILLLSILFSISEIGYAQIPEWSWAKHVGGFIQTWSSFRNSVAIDTMGNVYSIGFFWGTVDMDPGLGIFNLTSDGECDMCISKIDNSGNFVWAKRIGGISFDEVYCMTADPLGNVYISGDYVAPVDFDPGPGVFNLTGTGGHIFIAKLDSAGNFAWAKQISGYSNLESRAIKLDAWGNVYTTGTFSGTADFDPGPSIFNLTSYGGHDIFISKLDNSGNFVWAKRMGGAGDYEQGNSIITDPLGNVYTTGRYSGAGDFNPGSGIYNLTGQGGFISKLDSSGNFIWAKQLGGVGYVEGGSIATDAIGNVYSTGILDGSADFDPGVGTFNLTCVGSSDIFISKLDSSGNFVWAKTIGGKNSTQSYSMTLDIFGNIYITGLFTSNNEDFDPDSGVFKLPFVGGDADVFISKLNSSGNFILAKSIGGNNTDIGSSLVTDMSGNVYLTGIFYSDSISIGSTTLTNGDGFIAKLNQKPCNAVTCTINPTITSDKVTNVDCSNGRVIVNLGGNFQAFPHVELYDSKSTIISSFNLREGTSNCKFNNLEPGIYLVKVFDNNCCEQDMSVIVKCDNLTKGLKETDITTVSAKLRWKIVSCAISYRVEYREQGTSAWNNKYVNGNIGFKKIIGLMPSTTYEWRVANLCNGSNTYSTDNYSSIHTFTTNDLPHNGKVIDFLTTESFEINLFPNPAAYILTVNFETENATALLKVINIVGQVVYEKQLYSDEGSFEEQLDVSNFNTGIYLLLVKTENGISMRKFVKE